MIRKIFILGAGISGISAAYHLKEAGIGSTILEKSDSWGGLCDNFEIDGFRFDKFIHLSFTNNEYVKKTFNNSTEYSVHSPNPLNYYRECWLKHPVQNNLYNLDVAEKVKILMDFINKKTINSDNISNYDEWLRVQYGNYFAEKFPLVYTKKYWTIDASKLETHWIGNRMYAPTIEEVLQGAMTENTPNTYYAKEMRYPLYGGFKSFFNLMVNGLDIRLNCEVTKIDVQNREIELNNGIKVRYETLISSLPLPEILRLITGVPKKVNRACNKLKWTSGALISIGFNKPDLPKCLWFYIYDKEILASRIYSPSLKSKDNVPDGCSSIQAEIYFSADNPLKKGLSCILEDEIVNYVKMGVFNLEDIIVKDIRIEKYANVIFTHNIYKNRKIVRNFLSDCGISSIGRFGEWDYLWSDQSLLSGKDAANKIVMKYM